MWRAEIEQPALRLARTTVPTLNSGWGLSVGLVGTSWALYALVSYVSLANDGWLDGRWAPLMYGFQAMMLGTPALLALDPATCSSECGRLEDDLNSISASDIMMLPRVFPVLTTLKRLNKDQGLVSSPHAVPVCCYLREQCRCLHGFVVFGMVVTRRTLWLGMSALYGLTITVGPTLLKDVGLEPSCGAGRSQHASCPFGWTYADNGGFKFFGDDVLGPPLAWEQAEDACQQMGDQMHLASVTSEEQQRAVAQLARGNVQTWIGLADIAETGSFVWSDANQWSIRTG